MTVETLRKLLKGLNGTSYVYLINIDEPANAGRKLGRVMVMRDGKSQWVALVAE
jgi:hypothetical protein